MLTVTQVDEVNLPEGGSLQHRCPSFSVLGNYSPTGHEGSPVGYYWPRVSVIVEWLGQTITIKVFYTLRIFVCDGNSLGF